MRARSSANCSRGSNRRTDGFFSDEGGENSFASLAMDGVGAVPPPRAWRTMFTRIAISLSRSCEEIKVQAPFNFWCVVVGARCCSLHAVACPSLTG